MDAGCRYPRAVATQQIFVQEAGEEDLVVFRQVLGGGDERVLECVAVGCPGRCFVREVVVRWDDGGYLFEAVMCSAEALVARGWVGGVGVGGYGGGVGCDEGVGNFAEVHFGSYWLVSGKRSVTWRRNYG